MSEYIYEHKPSGADHMGKPVELPTLVQREEIVRCRDCEHMRELHPLNPITGVPAGITIYRCSYFWTGDELPDVEPYGFCAWGERRQECAT